MRAVGDTVGQGFALPDTGFSPADTASALQGRRYGEGDQREQPGGPAPPARPRAERNRPVIDGRRRGVRESLEAQVMAMAQSAAALFERELRLPDGRPVECVVADTCIGGVAEAAACAEQFEREGVAASPRPRRAGATPRK